MKYAALLFAVALIGCEAENIKRPTDNESTADEGDNLKDPASYHVGADEGLLLKMEEIRKRGRKDGTAYIVSEKDLRKDAEIKEISRRAAAELEMSYGTVVERAAGARWWFGIVNGYNSRINSQLNEDPRMVLADVSGHTGEFEDDVQAAKFQNDVNAAMKNSPPIPTQEQALEALQYAIRYVPIHLQYKIYRYFRLINREVYLPEAEIKEIERRYVRESDRLLDD